MLVSIASISQPFPQVESSQRRRDIAQIARKLWCGPRAVEVVTDPRMRKIAETIDVEPDNWNRIRKSASSVGLSAAYLSVRFKDALGMPMRSYALWMKFEHACELVLSGKRPSDAAIDAGFADQSHLGRAARRFAKKSFWRAIHELSTHLDGEPVESGPHVIEAPAAKSETRTAAVESGTPPDEPATQSA